MVIDDWCLHRSFRSGADRHDLRFLGILAKGEGPVGRETVSQLAGLWDLHRRAGWSLDVLGGKDMNSFVFNDAIRFKLVTQQEDTGAKAPGVLGIGERS